jgi:hypothetical protein
MRKLLLLIVCSLSFSAFAQDSDVKVDQLTAPSSPGFLILGREVTNIEKPTNPTDLLVSMRNASSDFSTIPRNFALDFTPYWVFGGGKTSFDQMIGHKNVLNNILQSFQLSVATQTLEKKNADEDSTQLGLGFKFSILRGKVSKKFIRRIEDEVQPLLMEANKMISKNIASLEENDPVYLGILKAMETADSSTAEILALALQERSKELIEKNEDKLIEVELADKLAQEVKLDRYGFKMDLAGGWAVSFPTQSFDNRDLQRFGIWLTAGYEFEESAAQKGKWSVLGVARYLKNYDEDFKDVNDVIITSNNAYNDLGIRLIYTYDNKLSLSAETINRNVIDSDKNIASTMRYAFNLNYQLPDNKIISFTYGKDFDGTINKEGNLIAALSLVIGIGSERPALD